MQGWAALIPTMKPIKEAIMKALKIISITTLFISIVASSWGAKLNLNCKAYSDIADSKQQALLTIEDNQYTPLKNEFDEVSDQLKKMVRLKNNLIVKINNGKRDRDSLLHKKANAPKTISNLERKNTSLARKRLKLKKEQDKVRKRMNRSNIFVRLALSVTFHQLGSQISRAERQIKNNKKEIRNLDHFLSTVDGDIAKLRQSIKLNKKRLQRFKTRVPSIADLKEQVTSMNEELMAMEEIMNEKKDSVDLAMNSVKMCQKLKILKSAYPTALKTATSIKEVGCEEFETTAPIFKNQGKKKGQKDMFNALCSATVAEEIEEPIE